MSCSPRTVTQIEYVKPPSHLFQPCALQFDVLGVETNQDLLRQVVYLLDSYCACSLRMVELNKLYGEGDAELETICVNRGSTDD